MNWIQKSIANFTGLDKFVNPIYFERYSSQFFDPVADFSNFSDDLSKLKIIFSNPAALKVFQICCNMFSMGKVYVYQNDKEVSSDPVLDRIKNPNFFQQQNQWLWDYKFWKMVGNAYCYIDSKIVTNDSNQMYWLDSSKMSIPVEMQKYKDKLILSKESYNKISKFKVKYTYADGTSTDLPWSNIIHIADLTNGTGDWFRGRSRIDALYKVVSNSEAALDAKNINVRYSGKFIVAGKSDPDNVSQIPLSENEKETIESKVNGRKSVHAVKSMVEIKRFVETAAIVGQLDGSYLADYFIIGSLFDIPKDVLEALNSGTFENQEKGRGAFVSYCLQPDADALTGGVGNFFGYTNKNILMDWEHLPFMQVFAKERAETGFKVTQSLLNLMKAGVPREEINAILDLKLTKLDYESANRAINGEAGTGQNQNQ